MKDSELFGIYLFTKSKPEQLALKDLMQFVRTLSPGNGLSFSYIEATTSLHPHLSLWENLQIETGLTSWSDYLHTLKPEQSALVKLIKDPDKKCCDSDYWEQFLVSLLKGIHSPSKHLLIDMNEELLSPFMIQTFKRNIVKRSDKKTVYLASANTSLWLDCAHSIVNRHEYKFEIQDLNTEVLRKYWAA